MPINWQNSPSWKSKKDKGYNIDNALKNLCTKRKNLIIIKGEIEKLLLPFENNKEIEERKKEIKSLTDYIESLQQFKKNNKYKLGKL